MSNRRQQGPSVTRGRVSTEQSHPSPACGRGYPSVARGGEGARTEKGLALIVTLLVLVVMCMVAMMMRRSIDTSTLAVGNLVEKQLARGVAGVALERLIEDIAKYDINNPDVAQTLSYYHPTKLAESEDGIPNILLNKPADGSGDMQITHIKDNGSYQTALVVERMCNNAGAFSPSHCVNSGITKISIPGGGVVLPTSNRGQDQNKLQNEGLPPPVENPLPLLRVTIRVDGPRDVVSIAQMFIVAQ